MQKSAHAQAHDAVSFTLSQGKKKRSMKQLNMADDDENDPKVFTAINSLGSIQDDSSSGSDSECEVFFDAKPSQADAVHAHTPNNFALDFQVSSVAVDRAGRFVVAGFNNGTIRLYPLSGCSTAPVVVGSLETDATASIDENKLVFRKGVVLEHISARGMYTQLRVNVVIPDDGRFIFAGVYRGSTEILVIDIDSIRLPTDVVGVPTAEVNTHSYSDAKLRVLHAMHTICMRYGSNWFEALVLEGLCSTTEYQVLCGLGIKNLHLWRFYWDPTCRDDDSKWTWQCIFDRQTNEYLAFGAAPNQIISKSEHQSVRVWTIDETADAMTFDFDDIKQTQDLPSSVAPTARPTLNNRKRQLRTVTLLCGVPDGITLGVCSDGSVFAHDMAGESGLGIHCPPAPVASPLLSLVPCDGSTTDDDDGKQWKVVMANSTQLQVLSLNEFLHLPPTTRVVPAPKPAKSAPQRKKQPSKKRVSPVQLDHQMDSTKVKKAAPATVQSKPLQPTVPQWSYNVVVTSTPDPKKRKDATPTLLLTTPEPKKRKQQPVVNSDQIVNTSAVKPSVVTVEPREEPTKLAITPHTSPEKPPPVVVPRIVQTSCLYRTPEPKKSKAAQVLSPVVSISPSSSPCVRTPLPSTPPATNDWSPFVIPKKTKAPAFTLDEPPQSIVTVPQQEEESTAPKSTGDAPVAVQCPSPLLPLVEPVISTPATVREPKLSPTVASLATPPHDMSAASPPPPHSDHTVHTCGVRRRSLLMQVTTLQLDDHLDAKRPLPTDVAVATTQRFAKERLDLMSTFQGAHRQLVRLVCTQMHRQQDPVSSDRIDLDAVRKKFQLDVSNLLGMQQLEADALHASHVMQWSVLGLDGFDMPRLVPTFPVPRLFG
ncbi:hypothetical protein DYB38_000248 [Aphanomyces astaci]|uniref:Uncharacterized protein n=1 Tax=Aphanomyces astaci TaxID=112090 RepID=A0A397DBN0_APHAT|nr:hypothetical protein DYB38_000248 [Aphanomyces astaci]